MKTTTNEMAFLGLSALSGGIAYLEGLGYGLVTFGCSLLLVAWMRFMLDVD